MFDRNRYDRRRMNLETISTHSLRRRSLSVLTSIQIPQKKSAPEKKIPAATTNARKAKAPTKGAAAKKQSIPNKDKAPKQPSTKGRGGGGDEVAFKDYDKAAHLASSGGAAKYEHLKNVSLVKLDHNHTHAAPFPDDRVEDERECLPADDEEDDQVELILCKYPK